MIEYLKILFIEDSEDDALLMSLTMKNVCSNIDFKRVDTKDKLKEALENKEWDLIIVDNALPQFTAIEAITLINDFNPEIPMICVSGSDIYTMKDQYLEAGAKAFILKDNPKLLTKTIEEIFQSLIKKSDL
ncbi:MAG: response regulator [Asgard group archaeon]|nr:response regulator [Asgard group archaeon]